MTPQFIEATLCGGGCHNSRQSCVPTRSKVSDIDNDNGDVNDNDNGIIEEEKTSLPGRERRGAEWAIPLLQPTWELIIIHESEISFSQGQQGYSYRILTLLNDAIKQSKHWQEFRKHFDIYIEFN